MALYFSDNHYADGIFIVSETLTYENSKTKFLPYGEDTVLWGRYFKRTSLIILPDDINYLLNRVGAFGREHVMKRGVLISAEKRTSYVFYLYQDGDIYIGSGWTLKEAYHQAHRAQRLRRRKEAKELQTS